VRNGLKSYFRSGEAIRSRSVSDVVLWTTLTVPPPPARLVADWERDIASSAMEPGDVEALPLARTRARWPDYRHLVQTMADWTRALGFDDILATHEVALMACRGARYHHDGSQYGHAAFCNLFLSDDCGLDLHFSAAGHRIPLTRGSAVIFDTGQPHAVVPRGSSRFDVADFGVEQDCTQVFLTWELPVEHTDLARALGIAFDVDGATASQLEQEQLRIDGVPAVLCPNTGRWAG
jgi:hypothetical protein